MTTLEEQGISIAEWGGLQCAHTREALRWRVRSNNVGVYVYQCLMCGRELRTASKSSPDVLNLTERKPFDERVGERWQKLSQQYRDQRLQLLRDQQANQNAEWWQRYSLYLKTPQWRAKRALVMERAQGLCEGCRRAKATQIHHLTYDHVGNELLFELVALCEACHERAHEKQ